MRRTGCGAVTLMVLTDVLALGTPAHGQVIDFIRQFGSSGPDIARSVAVDATGVYVVGVTLGTLPGQTSLGSGDAFVRKYDKCGRPVWTRQFGTADFDDAFDVDVNELLEHVAIVGGTSGQMTVEHPNPDGQSDGFLRAYKKNGDLAGTCQIGHPGTSVFTAVTCCGGAYYFVAHQGLLGQVASGMDVAVVRVQVGFPCEVLSAIAGISTQEDDTIADLNRDLFVGHTSGSLFGFANQGGTDAFLYSFFNPSSHSHAQFGTPANDRATGVSQFMEETPGEPRFFAAGWTDGTLPGGSANAGGTDAFVRKHRTPAQVIWTRQFGTSGDDLAAKVVERHGRIYVVGSTEGTLPGQTSAGGTDAFVRAYDVAGAEQWTTQFGSLSFDAIEGVAADDTGIYVVGRTSGALAGQANAGGFDAILVKLHSGLIDLDILKQAVTNLGRNGSLASGQVQSLVVKLDRASASFRRAQSGVARSNVESFVHEVDDLVENGRLTRTEAGPLIERAGIIIAYVPCF